MGSGTLINREVELCALHQSLVAPEGTTVLITGPSGAGKTTVIADELAQHPEFRVFRVAPDASSQLSDHALTVLADQLGCAVDYAAAGDESEQVRVLFGALDDQPEGTVRTVLVLEDSQWLDAASERVLWGLLRVLGQLNVTALVARHPDESWFTTNVLRLIAAEPQSRLVELHPLGLNQVEQYLRRSLGAELPRSVSSEVTRATGGLPLYLEAIVGLVRSGRVRSLTHAVETITERVSRDHLLADLVEEQVEAGGPSIRVALLALALAEGLTWTDLSATLVALDEPRLTRAALLRTTLVLVDQHQGLQVRHAAIARLLIDEAPLEEQLRVRQTLAEVLPPGRALQQRIAIGVARPDPGLVVELVQAVAAAHASGDHEEAIRMGAALARVEPSTLPQLGIACLMHSREDVLDALIEYFDGAAPTVTMQILAAFASCRRRELDRACGQVRALLNQPMSLAEFVLLAYVGLTIGGSSILVGEVSRLSLVHQTLERLAQVLPQHMDDPEAAGLLLIGQGLSWTGGPLLLWEKFLDPEYRYDEGIAALEGYERELEQLPGAEHFRATVLLLKAELLREAGLGERAALAFEHMQQVGLPELHVELSRALTMTWLDFAAGRWDEAHREVSRLYGRTLATRPEGSSVEITVLATLIPLVRGETAITEQRLRLAEQLMPRQERVLAKVHLRVAKVWAAVIAGDNPRLVAEELHDIWGTLRYGGIADHSTLILLTRAALEQDLPEAIGLVQRELVNPRWPSSPRIDYVRAHCRALITAQGEDVEAGLAGFAAAWQALADQRRLEPHTQMRLFASILAEDEVGHLQRLHADGVVVEPDLVIAALARLRLAVRRCTGLGQAQWATRLADLAAQFQPSESEPHLPSSPHSRATRGLRMVDPVAGSTVPVRYWEAAAELTSRERQITELVAEGCSNKEIAAELFVSVRTVEYHVGNVLAKLGCRSRVELRRLVREAGGLVPPSPTSPARRPFTAVPSPARPPRG